MLSLRDDFVSAPTFLPILQICRYQLQEGVARAEMLISVMEPDEKRKPDLLISDPTAPARLRRIARDAGVKTSAVSVSQERKAHVSVNVIDHSYASGVIFQNIGIELYCLLLVASYVYL